MASLRSSLCIVMISMLMFMLIAVTCVNAQTTKAGVQTVLVFPLDNDTGTEGSQAAIDISAKLADGLSANGNFETEMYSSRLPSVQRLVATNPEKKISTSGPFAGNAKAIADTYAISNAAGVNLAIAGTLDKFSLNDKNVYEASVTILIFDMKKKDTMQTVVASASADTSANIIQQIANRVIEQITGKPVSTTANQASVPSSEGKSYTGKTTAIIPFAYPISDDETANAQNKQIAQQLQTSLEKEINLSKLFAVVRYTAATPSIKRAVKEGKIKASDLTSPTDTTMMGAGKAQKIANILGVYTSILGSVDSSSVTDAAVNITATIQVISSKTGKADNSIVINGSAANSGSDEQKAIISKAVSDAVSKIIGQLRGTASK